jgi:signal transduction histidine kinase
MALYFVATTREQETPWTLATTATVVGVLLSYLGVIALVQQIFPTIIALHTSLVWTVAWFAGERMRLWNEHTAELKRRAIRAEREAERDRLLAAATERARIARDLHDSVGHAISVMGVRAGAARLRPDRALPALEAIEEMARHTVAEMDHIVGLLREGRPSGDRVDPPPGLGSIQTLIADRESAGLDVTFSASGTPRPVSAAADQAAYRILQEALTNAARHGAGTVSVELAFADAGVELTVTNPVTAEGAPPSRGHGLTGMRERATLLGGRLDARSVDGAFRVHARIPYGGHRL